MRTLRLALPFAAMLLASLATAAAALDLTGRSSTYLQSRQDYDTTQLKPLYEYLTFDARELGTKNLSFHFGGWYRDELQHVSIGDQRTAGDLQYAYLRYRADTADAFVNLGRILVNQGVAYEPIDGVSAGTGLNYGFSISAFGGVPVATSYDTRQGDSIYGGHISHEAFGVYRIGVSSLVEKNDHLDFRKEERLDLWFRPLNKAELVGSTLYNAITSQVARNAYNLKLGPFSFLTLRAGFTEVVYKDYFASTPSNIFQLQPGGLIDPKDKLTTIGGTATLTFGPVALSGDYKKYHYALGGDASYYGGMLAYTQASGLSAGAAAHRMEGQTDNQRFHEYRAYIVNRSERMKISVDFLAVQYAAAINGVTGAYTATLSSGYKLTKDLQVGADIDYAQNPFFHKEVRGFLKLVYNFSTAPAYKAGDYE